MTFDESDGKITQLIAGRCVEGGVRRQGKSIVLLFEPYLMARLEADQDFNIVLSSHDFRDELTECPTIHEQLFGKTIDYVIRNGKELEFYCTDGHIVVLQADIHGDIHFKKTHVKVMLKGFTAEAFAEQFPR